MKESYFFYDLETTGFSASNDRIMQFAGQRMSAELTPIEKPYNILIKQSPEILPSPDAILLTGILPEKCNKEGVTEAEFSNIFNHQIATPNTIFVGFNNIRFDDEFIRYTNYRNFYDSYEWHWSNGRSRWDILGLVMMTRALRPEGIEWPVNEDRRSINKLVDLASSNGLLHESAHDALSDVSATAELAKLIKQKQPRIFDYLLNIRSKDKVLQVIDSGDSYVYSSRHYSDQFLATTIVRTLSIDRQASTAQVYDLRQDPEEIIDLSVEQLVDLWTYDKDKKDRPVLPINTMKYNRCPTVADIRVVNDETADRLSLDMDHIKKNEITLHKYAKQITEKVLKAVKLLDDIQEQKQRNKTISSVDSQLYSGFFSNTDRSKFEVARTEAATDHPTQPDFSDQRLDQIFKLYRARNFGERLTKEEIIWWHDIVCAKLTTKKDSETKIARYFSELQSFRKEYAKDIRKLETIDNLEAYARSIESEYVTG